MNRRGMGWAVAAAVLAGVPIAASAQNGPPPQQSDGSDAHRGDRRGGGDHGGGQDAQAPAATTGSDRRGPDGSDRHGGDAGRHQDGQGGYAGRGQDGQGGNRWGPNAPGGQGGYAGRGPDGDRRGGAGYGQSAGWNGGRGDWRADRRYDWRGWRDQHHDLFRGSRYVAPGGYGYGYRAFATGSRLQPLFYGRSYWIADPASYRLPPAEGPYRWIRYYNDVLLVDLRSGVIVDAVRGFFW